MRRASCALIALLLLAALRTPSAQADGDADPDGHGGFASRPDSHAPIGVMGDHMHKAGEWMLSYRWARMRMDGNRDGVTKLSAEEVLAEGYMATPTEMDTDVWMFGGMYAPTDWVTLGAMLPVMNKSMDHRTGAMAGFRKFTTTSTGIGDFSLTSMWRLWENEHHHFHLNFGMRFPTGRIRATDDTPAAADLTLPFPMQLGSGTFDFVPGLTYFGNARRLSWGAQAMGVARVSENRAGWAASDSVNLTSWLAVPVTSWMSLSGRFEWRWWSNYRGDEPRPPPAGAIPTADPSLRAGQRIDLLPGINFYVPLGPLGKHRFAVEGGFPVYQFLKGPQLEADWRVILGWQKAF